MSEESIPNFPINIWITTNKGDFKDLGYKHAWIELGFPEIKQFDLSEEPRISNYKILETYPRIHELRKLLLKEKKVDITYQGDVCSYKFLKITKYKKKGILNLFRSKQEALEFIIEPDTCIHQYCPEGSVCRFTMTAPITIKSLNPVAVEDPYLEIWKTQKYQFTVRNYWRDKEKFRIWFEN
jgi:hypothetical protein